jgi:hypothetical protein
MKGVWSVQRVKPALSRWWNKSFFTPGYTVGRPSSLRAGPDPGFLGRAVFMGGVPGLTLMLCAFLL